VDIARGVLPREQASFSRTRIRVGIAADHGGIGLKDDLLPRIRQAGYDIVDFGAFAENPNDDYPDFVIPLGKAIANQKKDIQRGIAICGSGVGASVCANKIAGIRAALIHDTFSARQGVEDDHINILCLGGRTMGSAVAWELVQIFLAAEFSRAERHVRRLRKVASLESAMQDAIESTSRFFEPVSVVTPGRESPGKG
jgi:ribose 5-phosphate isomerase B